ncbi:unnamed protein product [Agarophyton chilense]
MKPPSSFLGMQHPGPMEEMPFPMPPLHSPSLGMPPNLPPIVLPLGFGIHMAMGMPPMGMILPLHPGAMPMNGPGPTQGMGMPNIPNRRGPFTNGRVDSLMRPKPKSTSVSEPSRLFVRLSMSAAKVVCSYGTLSFAGVIYTLPLISLKLPDCRFHPALQNCNFFAYHQVQYDSLELAVSYSLDRDQFDTFVLLPVSLSVTIIFGLSFFILILAIYVLLN